VALCLHDDGDGPAQSLRPLQLDARTGVWSTDIDHDLAGNYYTFLVDVLVDGVGLVRNRVTDPYAVSLSTDSRRGYVANLQSPKLKPPDWDQTPAPTRVQAATDAVVYELHMRDFSIGDATVRADYRGKYLAFTLDDTNSMRHLQALVAAGITDVHLLPVFDFGSVPELGCVTPTPAGKPDGESQQAAVSAVSARLLQLGLRPGALHRARGQLRDRRGRRRGAPRRGRPRRDIDLLREYADRTPHDAVVFVVE